MPIYCYKCECCGGQFEIYQSFSDDALTTCACGGKISRIIFATPVHYKGPGFAITESRGITGKKRKPKIKVGNVSDLPPEEQEGTWIKKS